MVSNTRPPSTPEANQVLRTQLQDKFGNNRYDRKGIADVFAESHEALCSSMTKIHEHEHEDNNDAVDDAGTQQRHQPNQKRQSCRHERSSPEKSTITHYNCTAEPSNRTSNHHQTGETRRSKLYTSRDLASPSKYRRICSIIMLHKLCSQLFFKRQQPATDAGQSVDQVRQRADEWHPPWVAAIDFKRHSTQLSTATYGRPCGNMASGSQRYRCSQSSTTSSEQQYTPTSKANKSTSSEEPNRETC